MNEQRLTKTIHNDSHNVTVYCIQKNKKKLTTLICCIPYRSFSPLHSNSKRTERSGCKQNLKNNLKVIITRKKKKNIRCSIVTQTEESLETFFFYIYTIRGVLYKRHSEHTNYGYFVSTAFGVMLRVIFLCASVVC